MRDLTLAQSARLERLADDHPDARVVDWLGPADTGGPIIEYRGGYRYINKWGRILATRKPRALSKVNL